MSYFEQGIKWHAPLGLDFGLGLWRLNIMSVQVKRPWKVMAKGLDFRFSLWRLHNMSGWRLHLLYLIGYFQLISLDSQQSLATQSHGLSTWMAIVWSGHEYDCNKQPSWRDECNAWYCSLDTAHSTCHFAMDCIKVPRIQYLVDCQSACGHNKGKCICYCTSTNKNCDKYF
jgi:hypothetical protein